MPRVGAMLVDFACKVNNAHNRVIYVESVDCVSHSAYRLIYGEWMAIIFVCLRVCVCALHLTPSHRIEVQASNKGRQGMHS